MVQCSRPRWIEGALLSMPDPTPSSRHIALLVDGDNAQPSLIEPILGEVSKHGVITTRRIYGDWTIPEMSGWKKELQKYAIQPIQQFRYTKGKNATDSALIIDAMDLLHTGDLGGFCIVSSDSDYTRLATRIREQGLFVMGIGRRQTPSSLVNACEVFVYTENLVRSEEPSAKQSTSKRLPEWVATMGLAIDAVLQEDGWANLGEAGAQIRKLDPAFDPRSYGFSRMSLLVRSRPDIFATEERMIGGQAQNYIKRA